MHQQILIALALFSAVEGGLKIYHSRGISDITRRQHNLANLNINDAAEAVTSTNYAWRLYADGWFSGTYVDVCPGITLGYTELHSAGLYKGISSLHKITSPCRLDVWDSDNKTGNTIGLSGMVDDFAKIGFNDVVSSIRAEKHAWEVFSDAYFKGSSTIVCPGQEYNQSELAELGLDSNISSARPIRATHCN